MKIIEVDTNPVVVPIFENKLKESGIKYNKCIHAEGVHQVELTTYEFSDDDYRRAIQIYDELISELRTGSEYKTRSIFHFLRSKKVEQGLTIFVILCALAMLIYLLANMEEKASIWGNTVWVALIFLVAMIILLIKVIFTSDRS